MASSNSTSSSDHPAVRMVDGVKIYGEGETAVRALRGVSLSIERGRFTAIMGPSGSGKSTLLHTLAGLDTLEEGEVFIDGTALSTLKDRQLTLLRREKVGFVFQTFNLIPTLNAEENILLPLSIAREDVEREWFRQIVETLGMDDRLNHRPSQLSGGQQQRVAVARALLSRPIIVCADEPTGNLDSRASEELLGFIRSAVDEIDQTVVMVTHDPLVAAFADEVVFLDDGRITSRIADPSADAIFDHLKSLGE
ncbi:MAG: ABC transporter ATP-binding protein [bacterium]|nr:ABC transporter ATP-binding protein [bacterium]